jgi:threonine synthase
VTALHRPPADPRTTDPDRPQRHRPALSRVRRDRAARRVPRLRLLLRAARGRLRRRGDRRRVSRERIEAGPRSLWRYADLLPVLSDDPAHRVDLGTGWTPLRPRRGWRAPRPRELWLKDDTRNPSGPSRTGSSRSRCPRPGRSGSTRSPARRPATSPTRCRPTPPPPGCPRTCSSPTTSSAARSSARRLRRERRRGRRHLRRRQPAVRRGRRRDGWGFVNVNLRAFYAEGSKTIGFEIAEQLGWELPDHVVAPIASGRCSPRSTRRSASWSATGWSTTSSPRMSGAQATGCSPVATPSSATASTCGRSGRTRSPGRWRSATRPTATTR